MGDSWGLSSSSPPPSSMPSPLWAEPSSSMTPLPPRYPRPSPDSHRASGSGLQANRPPSSSSSVVPNQATRPSSSSSSVAGAGPGLARQRSSGVADSVPSTPTSRRAPPRLARAAHTPQLLNSPAPHVILRALSPRQGARSASNSA